VPPVRQALTIERGYGQLSAEIDPASIEPAIIAAQRSRGSVIPPKTGSVRLQFDVTLPDDVLAAAADALTRHPDVALRAYGRRVDPTLAWLDGFEHVEHLSLDLWHATSFDVLAGFRKLRSLGLGQTRSRRPALGFLRDLTQLEELRLEAHDRDFAAVGDVRSLRRLALRVPRSKTLDPLRGHTNLQVFEMDFGGIRDLSPLSDLPSLRGLELHQIRKLDADDLHPIGECGGLAVVSLGALRNVDNLRFLARRPAATLRLLLLERLTGLATLADLAACTRLEQLGLYDTRPADRRLDVLLACPRLNRLVANDTYPASQKDALLAGFTGETLVLRGDGVVRGDIRDVIVRWRAPVGRQLDALD